MNNSLYQKKQNIIPIEQFEDAIVPYLLKQNGQDYRNRYNEIFHRHKNSTFMQGCRNRYKFNFTIALTLMCYPSIASQFPTFVQMREEGSSSSSSSSYTRAAVGRSRGCHSTTTDCASKQALELFLAASTTLAQTFAREKGLFCILTERWLTGQQFLQKLLKLVSNCVCSVQFQTKVGETAT